MLRVLLAFWLSLTPAWADGVSVPIAAPIIGGSAAFNYPPQSTGGTSNNMTIDSTQSGCLTSQNPTISYGTNQTSDFLVLFIQSGNGGQTVTSVVQSGNLFPWTFRTSTNNGTNNLYEYTAVTSQTLSNGITGTTQVNLSSSAFTLMQLIAIHGANLSSPFDPNAALPYHSGANADALITTTHPATLPIASYLTGSTGSPSAGSGFTGVTTAGCFSIAEYTTTISAITTPQSNLDMTLTVGAGLQTVGIGDAITQ